VRGIDIEDLLCQHVSVVRHLLYGRGSVLPPPKALELPIIRHLRAHVSEGSILQMQASHVELLSDLFWANRSMRHWPRSLTRWMPELIKSDLLGLPDVLGSRRACREHLPTWQAHRFGRNFGCFRAALQSNHTGMPRSLTSILRASQKPKREEPPIRSQDTAEHHRPDAASRGAHTHRRGSQWHRARRVSARGLRAPACLWDGGTCCSEPHRWRCAQAHRFRKKDRL